ncbi:MAG: GGDEF domain-containing protein, partial [Gemmatimonadetes bacterium]|nr:GGDEF domain-containing protein [Gemmatimonadota bacterium]
MTGPIDPKVQRTLADRYAVLLDAARTLASTRSLEELYRRTYRETARVLEADGFYISRLDAARDLARVVFYADRDQEQSAAVTYRGSESAVLRTGEPAIVNENVEGRSILTLGTDDSSATQSAITAPIRLHGGIAGAISAQSYRRNAYDESDLQLLQAIADIVGVAMENADQVAELERRRIEAERIEETGRLLSGSLEVGDIAVIVTEAALELLSSDGAHLFGLDGRLATVSASVGEQAHGSPTSFEVGDDLYGRLREGEAVVIDDVRQSRILPDVVRAHLLDGSLAAVPMVAGDRTTGFLAVSSLRPNAYDRQAVRLLTRLTAQASVAKENAELHSRLEVLSLTDPLTGLPNRRHLRIHLARETAAAVRGRRLAVVIFDVDGFKAHNDHNGHLEGDRALQMIAGILQNVGRAMNLVARFGGDEFLSV